jgi:hypothetical protein
MDTIDNPTTDETPTPKICDLKMQIELIEVRRLRLEASPEGLELHTRRLRLLADLTEMTVLAHQFSHTLEEDDPDFDAKLAEYTDGLQAEFMPQMEQYEHDDAAFYADIEQQLNDATRALNDAIAAKLRDGIGSLLGNSGIGSLLGGFLGISPDQFSDGDGDMPEGFTRLAPGIGVMVLGPDDDAEAIIGQSIFG